MPRGLLLAAVFLTIGACRKTATIQDERAKSEATKIAAQLKSIGSDTTRPVKLQFTMKFVDFSKAQSTAKVLRSKGFDVKVTSDQRNMEWECAAVCSPIPDTPELADKVHDICDAESNSGGKYDGWEAVVVEKPD